MQDPARGRAGARLHRADQRVARLAEREGVLGRPFGSARHPRPRTASTASTASTGDFYDAPAGHHDGHGSEDPFGNRYDLTLIENTDLLERKYVGLHTQFAARVLDRLNVGGNWTWSHTYGNFDGETAAPARSNGRTPVLPRVLQPRVVEPARRPRAGPAAPRARLRPSGTLPCPRGSARSPLSVLQAYDTGTPYGAVGPVDTRPYVTNPGYLTPPQRVTYYFTSRDAFRTRDSVSRTDLALNYSLRIANAVEIFVQPQVLNVFNNQAVIAGDTSVRTAFNAARFLPFNPFTETPVQGPRPPAGGTPTTNWDYGPTFGQARNVADYQQPRTFRVSMGVRF